MKICHMTSVHSSLDDRIFLKECVSLAKAGYKTYLVAPGNSFERNGVIVEGVGNIDTSRIQRMVKLTRNIYFKALDIDAEVYHIHDPELLPYALKLKKRGKKVIFDSHEDVPRQILAKEWLPKICRCVISQAYECYQRKVARKLDYIITATPHIENIFKEYGAKAKAIRNYPILDDINVSNADYYERHQILCYAGGLTEQRGIGELVDVSNKLGIELHLAGEIDDKYKERLVREKICENVIFEGSLNRKQICELYGKSRVGMALLHPTPNHINALAIKLFEYMAAGLPIICSNFPLWKEIVEKNGCGICVNPYKENEILKAVQFLLENEKEAKKMGDCGKKCVAEKFDWENEQKLLLKIYSDI